jgi:S1-C subfamily serine protease
VIDLLLLVVLGWYAVAGFRRGLAVGALSLAGFIGGALLAMQVAPPLAQWVPSGPTRSVAILVAVLVLAWTGQLLGSIAGSHLRRQVARTGAGVVDQVLGALASLAAVALVLWFVGGALREISSPMLARAVASSKVLAVIDAVVPARMAVLAGDFRRAVSDSAFPRVFEGVAPEQILPVRPPDVSAVSANVQATIRRSVVKVTGDAPACGRGQEGSGVVVAKGRVVTNAHVVAAVKAPTVQLAGGGRRYPARVVLFDPATDLAVLSVPDLGAPAMPLGRALDRGADAVVAGYPENGPYTVVPARVRSLLRAKGEDIYGGSGAVRQVYSLYATVEQGNSGGPLVATDGSLAGVVFAKSLDDPDTGYALTLDEVRDEIARGIRAGAAVSTGRCTAG